MPDAFVQVPIGGTGQKIDHSELTVGTNTVERQRVVTADPGDPLALAKVTTAAPAGTEYGVVTREAQMGTPGNSIAQPTGGGGVLGWLSGIYQVATATLAKLPAQGPAVKANSLPVVIATDQAAVPTNAQVGAPLIPTGAAALTINTDTLYTFAQTVHHVVVQNNTSAATGAAFDAAATAGSYQVPANSERVFDLACTVLHLYSAAASAVNGTAAANIVVMGAV